MSLFQVQSPVDSATMSPVERTAAWVLNNGQYEEVEEDAEQNPDEAKHAEKVDFILYTAHSRAAGESCPSQGWVQNGLQVLLYQSCAFKHRLHWHSFLLYVPSRVAGAQRAVL